MNTFKLLSYISTFLSFIIIIIEIKKSRTILSYCSTLLYIAIAKSGEFTDRYNFSASRNLPATSCSSALN